MQDLNKVISIVKWTHLKQVIINQLTKNYHFSYELKIYRDILINFITFISSLYLPFAFIINKYNPTMWEWCERALYVIAVAVTIGYGANQYNKK